jgi:hypothetical protein
LESKHANRLLTGTNDTVSAAPTSELHVVETPMKSRPLIVGNPPMEVNQSREGTPWYDYHKQWRATASRDHTELAARKGFRWPLSIIERALKILR